MFLTLRRLLVSYHAIFYFFLAGYCFLVFFTIFHHELWHEEMQGWLIAQSSFSFSDLYTNLRYESHPVLWYALLYVLTRFSANPFSMQLLNGIIACGTAFVFLKFAPFRLYQRILFIFGYFPLFEFGVISRNYLLGMLCIFLFCLFFTKRNTWWSVVSLILLMQTSILGLLVGILFGIYLVGVGLRESVFPNKTAIVAFCFLVGSASVSLYYIFPAKDYGITVDWVTFFEHKRFLMTILMIERGYVPIPHLEREFWNTNILIPTFTSNFVLTPVVSLKLLLALLLSVVLWVGSFLSLRKDRVLTALFSITTVGLLSFFYIFYYGAVRHWGYLFLVYVAAMWLYSAKKGPTKEYFFTAILLLQCIAGLFAIFMDIRYSFSEGKAVAGYISNNYSSKEIIGDWDTGVVTVVGYLHKSVYYPREGRSGSFAILDGRRVNLSESGLVQSIRERSVKKNNNAVVVLTYPLITHYCGIRHLKDFTNAITSDRYYLYSFERDVSQSCGL